MEGSFDASIGLRAGDRGTRPSRVSTLEHGEIHAIMGPNVPGKAPLQRPSWATMRYEWVTGGTVTFEGQDVMELEADERLCLGIFLASSTLCAGGSASRTSHTNSPCARRELGFDGEGSAHPGQDAFFADGIQFAERHQRGLLRRGEKKRNERSQMPGRSIRKPAIMDETDLGSRH